MRGSTRGIVEIYQRLINYGPKGKSNPLLIFVHPTNKK